MRVKVNGNEVEALSANVEEGYAMIPLLDADGKQVIRPNGEPDALMCRGVVELVSEVPQVVEVSYGYVQRTAPSDSSQES